MTEILHIAGTVIDAHGRYVRQRCSWCGAMLVDVDMANTARPLEPGEDPDNPKPWSPATWEVGAFVAVDDMHGVIAYSVVPPEPHPDHPGSYRIPKDRSCCIDLDPAATA